MGKCGKLFIVSTPIGNLEDITLRALRILKEVNVIAAEDTRHSRKLLTHYGINTPLISYHQHNHLKGAEKVIEKLHLGQDVAQISDAGMPGISDPGSKLVEMAVEQGIDVVAIPGPCAAIAALTVSGLPTARFLFAGALPHRPSTRKERLRGLQSEENTLVFYLSPHRLKAELADIYEIMGERKAVIAREITKRFEELIRKPLSELIAFIKLGPIRGEYTLVLEGRPPKATALPGETQIREMLDELMTAGGLSKKEAITQLAKELKQPKREIYKVGVKICHH